MRDGPSPPPYLHLTLEIQIEIQNPSKQARLRRATVMDGRDGMEWMGQQIQIPGGRDIEHS